MHQQTFALEANQSNNLDEYIASTSNHDAYRSILNWPNLWGCNPYNKALILKGEKASGKSFLAHIWASKSDARFIPNDPHYALENFNHSSAFIIDGFDDHWDEKTVLHYFNILNEQQKYLLITTTHLHNIKLADLSSRLKSVNLINIERPDDELIKIFIFKRFSRHSIIIDNNIVEYLAKYLPRNFALMTEYIDIINQYSLNHRKKVTIPLIKDCLKLESIF